MIAALDFVVVLLVVFIFLFFLSQAFLPLMKGTPLFPMFRLRPRLTRELERAKEELEEAILEKRIAETRDEATKLKGGKGDE